MKLLLCPVCGDVRKLGFVTVECECQKSWGYYLPDGLRAHYGGEAIIIGMDNRDVVELIRRDRIARVNRDYTMLEERFRADWFVIPEGHNIERQP